MLADISGMAAPPLDPATNAKDICRLVALVRHKAIALGYKVPADPNDKGEIFDDKGVRLTRAATPADYFPAPFANEEAARANNSGALPPDLSMIIKAREDGAHYVYSILTGFHETPPAGFKVTAGKYYNP